MMSLEFRTELFTNHTGSAIAHGWGIHATGIFQQIRTWQKQAGIAGRERISWPESKADFLEELWNVPATKIAQRLGCSQAAILMKAVEWDMPRPGHGYFQKKNHNIYVEISLEAKELLLKLRNEEAAKAKAINIPSLTPSDEPSSNASPLAESFAIVTGPAEKEKPASTVPPPLGDLASEGKLLSAAADDTHSAELAPIEPRMPAPEDRSQEHVTASGLESWTAII
jgi:hypothetical protein